MALKYYSGLLQVQGVQPKIISKSINPRLQISDLAVQGQLLSSWGAIYNGVPQISVNLLLPSISALQAKPKSATLCILFLTKMLAGLISLCIQPIFTITSNPFIIWSNISTHYGSLIFRDASYFLRSESQSQRTMQVQRRPILNALIWTVQLLLIWLVMEIYPSSEDISRGSL